MSKKKDNFKKKAILVELNKAYPQENIVDVVEFKEYGFSTGISIAVEFKEGVFHISDYTIEEYDIINEASKMLKDLKIGYEEVLKNNNYNRKFLIDQLIMQHVKDRDIYNEDTIKCGGSSSSDVLESFKEEGQTAQDIFKRIMDKNRTTKEA